VTFQTPAYADYSSPTTHIDSHFVFVHGARLCIRNPIDGGLIIVNRSCQALSSLQAVLRAIEFVTRNGDSSRKEYKTRMCMQDNIIVTLVFYAESILCTI